MRRQALVFAIMASVPLAGCGTEGKAGDGGKKIELVPTPKPPAAAPATTGEASGATRTLKADKSAGAAARPPAAKPGSDDGPIVDIQPQPLKPSEDVFVDDKGEADGRFVINMGDAGARTHLGEGWSSDESAKGRNWVWALGRRATATVQLDAGAAYVMTIRGQPVQLKEGSQRMEIHVNGALIARMTLRAEQASYILEIPSWVVSAKNAIEFRFARSASPKELDGTADDRPLAVQFDWIQFRKDLDKDLDTDSD